MQGILKLCTRRGISCTRNIGKWHIVVLHHTTLHHSVGSEFLSWIRNVPHTYTIQIPARDKLIRTRENLSWGFGLAQTYPVILGTVLFSLKSRRTLLDSRTDTCRDFTLILRISYSLWIYKEINILCNHILILYF